MDRTCGPTEISNGPGRFKKTDRVGFTLIALESICGIQITFHLWVHYSTNYYLVGKNCDSHNWVRNLNLFCVFLFYNLNANAFNKRSMWDKSLVQVETLF